MRVHIIGINYWPEVTGIAVFSTGRAEYLAAAGHEVTICAAVPYYPQWRVPTQYRGLKITREARAGVTILRCPIYVPSAVNPIRRVLHEASFIASAFLRSCSAGADILFAPRRYRPRRRAAIPATVAGAMLHRGPAAHTRSIPDVGSGRVAQLLLRSNACVSTRRDRLR